MKSKKLTRQPHFLMDNWYLLKKNTTTDIIKYLEE